MVIEACRTYEPNELKNILRLSEWTINKYCRERKIPAKKIGRKWIIEGECLLNYLRVTKEERRKR